MFLSLKSSSKAAEKFQDPVGIVGILEREAGWVGNRWTRIEHWKRIEFESEEFAESKIKKISGIENNHENQRMKSNHETKIDFLALSILRYQNHDRRVGFQGGNSSSGSCTSLHIR